MKYIVYLIALSFLTVSCQKEESVQSIINDFEDEISKAESWEYDIHYKMKYFSSDKDTLNFLSNCRLVRHQSDTIFGGSFWIKNDSIDRYYDLKNIYIINHKKRKITKYFPERGQDWAINGNTISGVLNTYYLKPNRASKYLKDSTITTKLKDTVIKNNTLTSIEFRFQDDLPLEQERKTLYFNKSNKLKHIAYSVKLQHEQQYNEWHFSNETYNSITDNLLKSEFDSLAKLYKVQDYKEPDPKQMEPLSKGIIAPSFNGFNFQTNDSIKLDDFKGKFVILDFWYKDCFPCINAISHLNKLRDKYASSQLEILGLNPYDNEENKIKKLPEFIQVNQMKYPTIFIENEVTKDYNVRAFPTFYVLNRKGEIIYSKVGHSEKNEQEIDSLFNQLQI